MSLFFTLTSAVMIKAGIKVRTMRYWLPSHASKIKVGSIHKAKLNRSSKSCFATIRIISVRQWDGVETLDHEHAIKEGFNNIEDFWQGYNSLNEHKFHETDRAHYIIDFEVVELCDSDPPVPDWEEPDIPKSLQKGTITGGLPIS